MENFSQLVPSFLCPDSHIEEIFRYRWEAYSTHIFQRANGKYIITEFSIPVNHSGVDGTISCPAHHHIAEGRWIKDRKFMRDYISFWCSSEAQPRLYSFPLANSCMKYCIVSGEYEMAKELYEAMKSNYEEWEKERFDSNYGLFWQIPDRDGMEFALLALSYGQSHGGEGYRSTLNSYMYADAVALAETAAMLNRTDDAGMFRRKAGQLKTVFQRFVWNRKRSFFVDRRRDNRFFINGIELEGYIPWCYNMPDEDFSCAWKYIMDEEYFCAPYGLRTLEKNHEDYLVEHSAPGKCMWNGWCWPFASSQALDGMANLLNNYKQNFVSSEDYFKLLKTYTMCHYKDGVPHLAESYDPENGVWYTDLGARSLNYNHSTYCDLVITGLAGFRPQSDGTVRINPLIPAEWDYFLLENLPCRGKTVSMIFDRNGEHFAYGKGLTLLVDGVPVLKNATTPAVVII